MSDEVKGVGSLAKKESKDRGFTVGGGHEWRG